ncbi:hypothetical protein [Moraxella sp. RCAD0137]|uniref:hypothetical protein n=1 Tax=Moraxella sp. RCAD0137 TaxID=1775913 RepID=UPI000C9FABA9|nr:hypothetical protein [Moraxella sp. RCAD0137]PNP97661.1 hypothetical protein AZ602_06505 [Moraxella sp. RCAD0137]
MKFDLQHKTNISVLHCIINAKPSSSPDTCVQYRPDSFDLCETYKNAISHINSNTNQITNQRITLEITILNYPDDTQILVEQEKSALNSLPEDSKLFKIFSQIAIKVEDTTYIIYGQE